MSPALWLLIGILAGAVIGLLFGLLRAAQAGRKVALAEQEAGQLRSQQTTLEQELIACREQLRALSQELQTLASAHARLQAQAEHFQQSDQLLEQTRLSLEAQQRDNATLRERARVLEETERKLQERFGQLAAQVLEQQQEKSRALHQEQLGLLLTPLKEQLGGFLKHVAESQAIDGKERAALRVELQRLQELNLQVSRDANNLGRALRGQSQMRGAWGEAVLSGVLERSGLRPGEEFVLQENFTAEDGSRLRPDALIRLPEERCLIIDAKAPLQSWMDWNEAEDGAAQNVAATALAQAIALYCKDLSQKNYHLLDGLKSPDFVLCFIPIEAALALALRQDPNLFQTAFDRGVVLVAPSTLLATLRTVASLWRQERHNRLAQEIATQAGRMYDHFVAFVTDLEDMGQRLRQAADAHGKALAKLSQGRGNLVGRAEKLRSLGARHSKRLPDHLSEDNQDNDRD